MASPRYMRPDELERFLGRIEVKINELRKEARWVHNVGYSRNPTAHAARGSKNASDPTGAITVGQRHVREKYRVAVGHIAQALFELADAERELKAAIKSADGEADEKAMTGDGIYPAIPLKELNDERPFLEPGELDDLRRQADRREAAGGGFGES